MKKTYSKPEILFDDFTLSTNIAAGCAVTTDTPQWDACGVQFGSEVVFVESVAGCIVKIPDDGSNPLLCYHVPTDTTKFFNSL